jgi:hypothetical protein
MANSIKGLLEISEAYALAEAIVDAEDVIIASDAVERDALDMHSYPILGTIWANRYDGLKKGEEITDTALYRAARIITVNCPDGAAKLSRRFRFPILAELILLTGEEFQQRILKAIDGLYELAHERNFDDDYERFYNFVIQNDISGDPDSEADWRLYDLANGLGVI